MLGEAVGIAILALAAFFIVRSCVRFKRTRGRSACDSCPYSNHCADRKCDS